MPQRSQKEYKVVWSAKPGRRRRSFTLDRTQSLKERYSPQHAGLPADQSQEFYEDAMIAFRADQLGLC